MLRIVLAVLGIAVATPVFGQTGGEKSYPYRAVHIVVPFPPGGPTDTYARILADKLQAALGQPFIVENKPGATGIIGTRFVANAPADGYPAVHQHEFHVASPMSALLPPLSRRKGASAYSVFMETERALVCSSLEIRSCAAHVPG
jgi:tripartite-type tricarboxylate transporter receptor subunit TctC